MDVHKLRRDPSLAQSAFVTKNGILTAKENCAIMIPKRFVERSLATVGSENRTIGICAWIVGDRYFVTLTNAYLPITPLSTREVLVDGDVYVLFEFQKNGVVCPNVNLVKDSRVMFQISEEILAKARVPWYMNYEDRMKMFRSGLKHAGTFIGSQREVVEIMTAANTRSKKDRAKFFRETLRKQEDAKNGDQVPTALKTVEDSATTTLTRITGSYMDRGMTAALNNPSERVEPIEEYLRA